jgi:hypothetical protein
MAYYHLGYRPGPALVEAMNSLVIYRRLQDLAAELPAASAAPVAPASAAPATAAPRPGKSNQ